MATRSISWPAGRTAGADEPETLAREVRALKETAAEHPSDRQLILTAASRLPFPEVPARIEILPAWQWMLESSSQ